jgi:hypothetical protein
MRLLFFVTLLFAVLALSQARVIQKRQLSEYQRGRLGMCPSGYYKFVDPTTNTYQCAPYVIKFEFLSKIG